MKQTICDKCKKLINDNQIPISITINTYGSFDLCTDCNLVYSKFANEIYKDSYNKLHSFFNIENIENE